MQRLKGYVEVKIVGMRYNYKGSNGQRLPNPLPGCPLSLQLEPSNQHHHNAIKVINDTDTRHLGYIARETADILTLLLNDNNTFASARAFLCGTHNLDEDVISCQVLLFFAVPLHRVPSLPPQLRFHDDLSSPDFVLASSPVALTDYTLHAFDEYKPQLMASLHLQTLLRPCSTNINSPVHVHDSDATAPLERSPQSQVQVPTDEVHDDGTVESDKSVSGPPTEAETQLLDAEMNEIVCMKCKQMGRGLFFQFDQNGCLVLIRESCVGGVVGHTCLFCLYLACREERFRSKKYSDLYVALKSKYKEVRKSAIRFFGKETFMRLRESMGLDPLLPTQVQVPCNANMKCNTKEGREKEEVGINTIIEKSASKEKKEKVVEKEEVGTSTIIEKSASKEKKEKVVEKEAVGTSTIIEKDASKEKKEKRLPPRPSYDRACKKIKQASSLVW